MLNNFSTITAFVLISAFNPLHGQDFVGTYKGRFIQRGTPDIDTSFRLRVTPKGRFIIHRTMLGQRFVETFQLYSDNTYDDEQRVAGQTVSIGSGSYVVTPRQSIKIRGTVTGLAGRYRLSGEFKFRGRRVFGVFRTPFANVSFNGKKR